MKLTQTRLKEVLNYNPDTGIFTWKVRPSPGVMAGDVAGYKKPDGYKAIKINGRLYFAHRLAWLFVNGYFPEYQIDHKNGVKDDNRISNLRHVSCTCNQQNRCISKKNRSGFPGVCWHKRRKKWRAHIKIKGKKRSLGDYSVLLNAALARLTEEVWNPDWTCNHRSELIKAIKKAWSEFPMQSVEPRHE